MARVGPSAEVRPVIHLYDEAQEFPREILAILGRTELFGPSCLRSTAGRRLDYVSLCLGRRGALA